MTELDLAAAPAQAAERRSIAAAVVATLLVPVLVVLAAGPTAAAPANQLVNGSVQPGSGTTATRFVFSVRYRSGQDIEPTSVVAVAGNVVVPLSLASGVPSNGRYRGWARLPVGKWPVTFQATARGNDPDLDGPTITVKRAPAPNPTPRPTPAPTAAPTSPPTVPPPAAPQTTAPTTPAPATPATPAATEPPAGSAPPSPAPTTLESEPAGNGASTATPGTSGDPAAGVVDDTEQQLITILTGGLIAIGALTLIGIFALLRDRRRRATDARLELLPEGAATEVAAPRPSPAARAPAAWERDFALDEEPIGTVEYRPPPEPTDPDQSS
jgi:hypothetical protein